MNDEYGGREPMLFGEITNVRSQILVTEAFEMTPFSGVG
jgi:hypothetical protein